MKPIPSCPGYFASEDGGVYRNGKRRKGVPNNRGYLTIMISVNNQQTLKYAHRLVCEAYHGPCPEGRQCRHLDGSRVNNAPSNLEWSDKATNEADKERHGTLLLGEKVTGAVLTAVIVAEARERARNGETIEAIAASYGVTRSGMGDAVFGENWRHVPGALKRGSTRTRDGQGKWRKAAARHPAESRPIAAKETGTDSNSI